MNNNKINFLISAINDNIKYIEFIYYNDNLTDETKNETIIKTTNFIINQSLELQTLIKNETYN